MPYVPPWLNVQPGDFVQAASAGGRLGAQLAELASQAAIARDRNTTALQEASMRENTALSGQQAEQALAGARLAQAQKQSDAERQLRQWEIQQQMLHNQAVIDAENQRSSNTITAENTRAANALDERAKYGQSMLAIRQEANRIAQERADNAENKPQPGDFMTVTDHTKEVAPSKIYDINKPGVYNWFSPNTPPSSMTTTNVADLQNLPRGSTIVTNTIPGTGTPARTFSRRVPVGQDPYALTTPAPTNAPATTPLSPLEGKQVRHKDTGETGTIINGQFVPDKIGDEDEM